MPTFAFGWYFVYLFLHHILSIELVIAKIPIYSWECVSRFSKCGCISNAPTTDNNKESYKVHTYISAIGMTHTKHSQTANHKQTRVRIIFTECWVSYRIKDIPRGCVYLCLLNEFALCGFQTSIVYVFCVHCHGIHSNSMVNLLKLCFSFVLFFSFP